MCRSVPTMAHAYSFSWPSVFCGLLSLFVCFPFETARTHSDPQWRDQHCELHTPKTNSASSTNFNIIYWNYSEKTHNVIDVMVISLQLISNLMNIPYAQDRRFSILWIHVTFYFLFFWSSFHSWILHLPVHYPTYWKPDVITLYNCSYVFLFILYIWWF